ncbi:MAG TPA: dihydroorotate dehydrogenase electron transfer subunit, partial [Clostridiales bacterium]|nr:dihydroorotate dehydrogenase electron transfer subunit [Clostridiales bacterium]
RRPISVLRSDPVTRAYEIGYEVRGRGTEYLSRLKPDDIIDVIGPLGNEFEIKGEYKKIAIVGGGIGVFPLVHLMESLPETVEAHTFFGFKNREKILWEILKKPMDEKLYLSTDDNSYGYGGFITDLFKVHVEDIKPDAVFTCGPKMMMKICADICLSKNIECYVSLEERMACGIGACLGCACQVKKENGSVFYGHVCKDGPVFNARSVVL